MYRKLIVTLALALPFSAFAQLKVPAGSYDIDVAHSKIGFEIPHLVISTVEGTFKQYSGKVEVNDNFSKSKVSATVEIPSIDTGIGQRDDHLRSADFFDAEKHPKMTFQSTKITGTPEKFELEGDLTIKGNKKRVKFSGKYLGAVVDGYGNQKIALQASTKISRKDFGLTWSSMVEAGPVVGDEVTIDLKIQAGRPAPKK